MIFTRIGTFGLFVALALAMFAWQANDLIGVLTESPFPPATAGVIGASLLVLGILVLANKKLKSRTELTVFAFAGMWEVVLTFVAAMVLFVGLPIALGLIFMGGGFGLTAGWAGIKAQFFVVVDYFLVRSLLHFFASGASAFISLRYLRRRVMSILSVVGILLGVLVLIVVNSVMSGFQQDFREQIRGSLSHVLIRFDSQDFENGIKQSTQNRAEWVAYIEAINDRESTRREWAKHEEVAVENFRALIAKRKGEEDRDEDAVSDFARAQPPIEPPPAEVETIDDSAAEELAFLERLRTGTFIDAQEEYCLSDENGRINPKSFYLNSFEDKEKSKAESDVTKKWFWPLFRARMEVDFKNATKAIERHRDKNGELDVIGVSPRVSTRTFITPTGGKQKELPIAELIGVDVVTETEISNLGQYVAAAEVHSFREEFILRPMRNLLAAALPWQSLRSREAMNVDDPGFLYMEDGKPLGKGPMPRDMTRYLHLRRLSTGVGKLRWAEFDKVEYWEFSPGQAIYDRVQEAYKAAERTDEYDELKELLEDCISDIQAIVKGPALSKADSSEEQIVRKGCRIILFNYLTTIDLITGERRFIYKNIISQNLTDALDDPEEPLKGDQRRYFLALQKDINNLFAASMDGLLDTDIDESAREARYVKLLKDVLDATGETSKKLTKKANELDDDSYELLVELLSQVEHDLSIRISSPLLQSRLRKRRSLPALYLLEVIDAGIETSRTRFEAYQKVLPLRTSMMPDESIESYLERASKHEQRPSYNRPGIILGDALANSPALSGIRVGDEVAITIPRIFYDDSGRLIPRTTEVWFEVTGFFRSGLFEDNLGKMYCDFEELAAVLADSEVRYYLGAKLKDYTPYEGKVAGAALKDEFREELRSVGLHAYVTVWEDEKRTLLEAVNREKTILGLIVSMIILLAGGGIVIVIYQLVNEKVRDIGILKSLGQSPWGIRSLFMFNALFIGVFGAAIGALAGVGVSEYLNEIEDVIDSLTGIRLFPEDIYFLTYIPTVKGIELLKLAMNIAMPVVMFSFFCGIFPAMLAARKDPVEALHHE